MKNDQSLELYLRRYITPGIPFQIDEFRYRGKERIVVFKVPAAEGLPTSFFNEPYVRINESTTSLRPYTEWIREIYNSTKDWSKEIIENASLDNLDHEAITIAQKGYQERYPKFAEEMDKWDLATFLDRAGLTIDGRITRTTLLLVGKESSVHHLNHIAQINWKYFGGEIRPFCPQVLHHTAFPGRKHAFLPPLMAQVRIFRGLLRHHKKISF